MGRLSEITTILESLLKRLFAFNGFRKRAMRRKYGYIAKVSVFTKLIDARRSEGVYVEF